MNSEEITEMWIPLITFLGGMFTLVWGIAYITDAAWSPYNIAISLITIICAYEFYGKVANHVKYGIIVMSVNLLLFITLMISTLEPAHPTVVPLFYNTYGLVNLGVLLSITGGILMYLYKHETPRHESKA